MQHPTVTRTCGVDDPGATIVCMPAVVTHDRATGIWTLELSGSLDAEQVAAAIGTMYASEDYQPDAPRLYDARSVEDSIATRELRALAYRREFIGAVDHARSAIVVARKVTFGIARMYQSWMDDQPVSVRIFHDIDEARAWLAGESDETAD